MRGRESRKANSFVFTQKGGQACFSTAHGSDRSQLSDSAFCIRELG